MFHGLHGLFHDSLPDGWGLRLINRELARRGLDPATVSPLERLQFLGTRAMGGLTYRPVLDPDAPSASIDLGELADQSARLFEGSPETVLPTLARLGGSAAGARPKVLVAYDPVSCEMRSGTEDAPPNFHSYLVKFPNKEDGADIGRVEMAYAAMAREAGIDMPVTRLFNAGRKRHCFGVERFDRVWNFAFLMQPTGQWRLSPAYDLVYAPGPGGEHSMMIGTAASRPTFGHLLQVAAPEGLAPAEVSVIVDQVAQSVRRWRTHAGTFDVARATVATVDDAVARALACLR